MVSFAAVLSLADSSTIYCFSNLDFSSSSPCPIFKKTSSRVVIPTP
jgi:hypothetical protein